MKSKMPDTSNARDLSLLDEGFFDSQSEMLEKKYGLDNIDLGDATFFHMEIDLPPDLPMI